MKHLLLLFMKFIGPGFYGKFDVQNILVVLLVDGTQFILPGNSKLGEILIHSTWHKDKSSGTSHWYDPKFTNLLSFITGILKKLTRE